MKPPCLHYGSHARSDTESHRQLVVGSRSAHFLFVIVMRGPAASAAESVRAGQEDGAAVPVGALPQRDFQVLFVLNWKCERDGA